MLHIHIHDIFSIHIIMHTVLHSGHILWHRQR